MRKNYNQPIVEVVEVLATSLMQAASPGALLNSGSGTDGLGDTSVPIEGD